MRKIILNLAVTLDGYIEGPKGEIDWCRIDGPAETGAPSFFDRFLSEVDTIFYGRVSYDLWGEYLPGPDAGAEETKLWTAVHGKTKYVFSRTTQSVKTGAIYISGDVAQRVEQIKAQPGKDIWLYGGAGLITSFMELNLVDRFLLAVHPVILGGGKPLFSSPAQRTDLRLIGATTSPSGVVLLEYDNANA